MFLPSQPQNNIKSFHINNIVQMKSNQSVEKMPDLYTLPPNVQLQIYDLFLSLRTYQRQCRLNTICTIINKGRKQKAIAGELHDYSSISDVTDLKVNEMNVHHDEELYNSIPEIIRNGKTHINFVWSEVICKGVPMLSRCSNVKQMFRVVRWWW